MTDKSVSENMPFPFEADLMHEIDRTAVRRTVEAGAVLINPGQPILYVPILLSGSIKIMRPDEKGGELLLYYLNPADSCALSMSSLLSDDSSPILAVVEKAAQLLMIPVQQAEDWMGRYVSWRQFVFQTYQKRFDDLLQTLDSVAFRQLDDRLLAYLNQKASLARGRHLYITHDTIARDLNSSREVISRLLKQLERRGFLQLSRNKISMAAAA